MAVDTKTTTDRRAVRFERLADLRADLDRLERAHVAGRLRRGGNWTEGQVFTHLAAFIEYGYGGYPKEVSPPWFVRWIIRLKKREYLSKGMPAGVRIPGTKEGTIGMEDVGFEEGLARYRAAVDRLEQQEPPVESPAFGAMSHGDKVRLQLRHAELHLSFLHPEGPGMKGAG